ncbi:MAG: acylphosphatase [Chloroflexia bacterium]|nr:acylphosphatase [Chloroflexia bacterium]
MAAKRVHLWIRGRVQGVSFRYYTRRQARALGLSGWVKNLPDGRVEVVAEGDEAVLQELVDWCHQGPPAAHVAQVQVRWESYVGGLSEFGIAW